jgi:hypothetical protein
MGHPIFPIRHEFPVFTTSRHFVSHHPAFNAIEKVSTVTIFNALSAAMLEIVNIVWTESTSLKWL